MATASANPGLLTIGPGVELITEGSGVPDQRKRLQAQLATGFQQLRIGVDSIMGDPLVPLLDSDLEFTSCQV